MRTTGDDAAEWEGGKLWAGGSGAPHLSLLPRGFRARGRWFRARRILLYCRGFFERGGVERVPLAQRLVPIFVVLARYTGDAPLALIAHVTPMPSLPRSSR